MPHNFKNKAQKRVKWLIGSNLQFNMEALKIRKLTPYLLSINYTQKLNSIYLVPTSTLFVSYHMSYLKGLWEPNYSTSEQFSMFQKHAVNFV